MEFHKSLVKVKEDTEKQIDFYYDYVTDKIDIAIDGPPNLQKSNLNSVVLGINSSPSPMNRGHLSLHSSNHNSLR